MPTPSWVYSDIDTRIEGLYQQLADRFGINFAEHDCHFSDIVDPGTYTCDAVDQGGSPMGTFRINVRAVAPVNFSDPIVTLL